MPHPESTQESTPEATQPQFAVRYFDEAPDSQAASAEARLASPLSFAEHGAINDSLDDEARETNKFGLTDYESANAARNAFHNVHTRELNDDYDPDSQVAVTAAKLTELANREMLKLTHRLEEPMDKAYMQESTLASRRAADAQLLGVLSTDVRLTGVEAKLVHDAIDQELESIPRHAEDSYAQLKSLQAAEWYVNQQTEHEARHELQ